MSNDGKATHINGTYIPMYVASKNNTEALYLFI